MIINRKRIAVLICCVWLIITIGSPCLAAGATNLLINGGFERVDSAGRAVGWYQDSWNHGAMMAITAQRSHSGHYAAILQAGRANDSRIIQSVAVEPDTVYELTGWVATRGVRTAATASQAGSIAGANLSVLGCTVFKAGLTGNHHWQFLKFIFRTRPAQTQITVAARLGFYGQICAGVVYFDDLRLEKVSDPAAVYQLLDKPRIDTPDLRFLEAPRLNSPDLPKAFGFSLHWDLFFPFLFGCFFIGALIALRYWPLLNKVKYLSGQSRQMRIPPAILIGLIFLSWFLKILFREISSPPISSASFFALHGNAADALWSYLAILCDSVTAWLFYLTLKRKNPVRALGMAAFFLFLPALFYTWNIRLPVSFGSCLVVLFFFLASRKQLAGMRPPMIALLGCDRLKRRGLIVLSGAWLGLALFLYWPEMGAQGLLPVITLLLLAFGWYRDAKLYYGVVIMSVGMFINMAVGLAKPPFWDRILYILTIVNGTLLAMLTVYWLTKAGAAGMNRKWKRAGKEYSRHLWTGLAEKLRLQPFKLTGKDLMAIAILGLVYAFLLFYALGSRATPQTGYHFYSPAQGVEIRLAKLSTIRTLAFYDAEGTGNLQAELYRNGRWEKAGMFNCDNYFVLRRESVAWKGVGRLRFIPQPAAGHVNEIALLDLKNRIIPIRTVRRLESAAAEPAARSPLFDEQARMSPRPSYLNSTYFDEIYHGRTAYEFVKGTPVYENTHPPFGKDVLALGILLWGMNPLGMRVMHAIAGLCLIVTFFFLGRMVLATRFGAYSLMIMGMLDFMPLVQSRYATIDSTSVLFITLMFLFAFKLARQQISGAPFTKLLGTTALLILCFSLAAATKWTAFYGSAGVFLIFVVSGIRRSGDLRQGALPTANRRCPETVGQPGLRFWKTYSWPKLFICALLLFILIAPLVYYLTYIPYLKTLGISKVFSWTGCRAVLENQAGMYRYHSQLTATHPFSSSWWSWPFNFKPLWLYTDAFAPAGQKGSIVSLGNPLLWYVSLLGLAVLLFCLLSGRRQFFLSYLMVCMGAQYLPWVLVSRVTFIYHFYPVLPWFLICAVLIAEPLWRMEQGRYRSLVLLGGVSALVLLIMFYPVLVGMDVPQEYIDHFLRWFPKDWIF